MRSFFRRMVDEHVSGSCSIVWYMSSSLKSVAEVIPANKNIEPIIAAF